MNVSPGTRMQIRVNPSARTYITARMSLLNSSLLGKRD